MKDRIDEAAEWTMDEGDFSDYDILRCLRSSEKWTAYLAKDRDGNRLTLTYIEKEKAIERYRLMAHQSGTPETELGAEASRLFEEYQKGIMETVERVKGLGSERVAETKGCSYDRERDQLVVVSEYVPGVDLLYASGKLKPEQLICLFAQAADGLSFVHTSGFLHLNVKPSRILVDFEGDAPGVKLTDFGFAVPIGDDNAKLNGTLYYMSPEVILEQRDRIDARADLYSFGATMYYCLTGHQPRGERFTAHAGRQRLIAMVEREGDVDVPPSHYNREISSELDEMVMDLLKKNPDDRKFANAQSLLNFMYEKWPEEAGNMVSESTSTLVSYE